MIYEVDYKNISTIGLDTSLFATALAALRANEARYLMNKYKHKFTVISAEKVQIP